jgi:hypothetical protein
VDRGGFGGGGGGGVAAAKDAEEAVDAVAAAGDCMTQTVACCERGGVSDANAWVWKNSVSISHATSAP